MILKNPGKDVKILGVDVSEDAIKQAKSKKFLMQRINNRCCRHLLKISQKT